MRKDRINFLILLIFSSPKLNSCFTCQGSSFKNALTKCPDGGAQKLSSGGNVTVFIKNATNVPNLDIYPLSSIVSDPYVEIIFGDNVRKVSKTIRNNLNPVWNEEINLGVLGSATALKISVWDYDMGLEFSDDLAASMDMRVPFCSMFNASYQTISCDDPFQCYSDDSNWQMPTRQLCTEPGYVNFGNTQICDTIKNPGGGGLCLYLEFRIVPFILDIELIPKSSSLTKTPIVTAASSFYSAPWTSSKYFGCPFLADSQNQLDVRDTNPDSRILQGALMFRLSSNDRYVGLENEILFYAGVNLPATIYVCRNEVDNAKGIPGWLSSYDASNISATQLTFLGNNQKVFDCFFIKTEGTMKNRFGGVDSGAIPFHSNTITNHDGTKAQNIFYDNMYIVLAIPRVEYSTTIQVVVTYTNTLLLISILSYGIIWAWFMFIITRFIRKIEFRIDRLMTYLTTRVYTGKEKSLIATLFMTYGETPHNIEYRTNLYHAHKILQFFLFIPFLLLIGWGFSCAGSVQPQAIGYAITFLGISCVFLWYGFGLWEIQNWQMSPYTFTSILLSVAFCLIFFLSVIFADPAVVQYGLPLDFTALSLVCGTINTIPLILLVFRQDKVSKKDVDAAVTKMTEAVYNIKQNGALVPPNIKLSANKAIHALLGNGYTINPKVSLFQFATVLRDLNTSKRSDKQIEEDGKSLYYTSLFILFVYLMIAIIRTNYPSIAFLHCLTFILLDSIHSNLAKGEVNWSPGYHIILLVAGRLAISSTTANYWLLNYSIAFIIYALALIQEIVDTFLPTLSKRQAGEFVFAGKDLHHLGSSNISSTVQFSLGLLVLAYIFVVLVAIYSYTKTLGLPNILVWGAIWPMYTVGVIAFLAMIVIGLCMATARAFYLQKNGLLRGFAKECYFLHVSIKLPLILSLFLEIAIVCSGILLYAITTSTAILIGSIFIPIICISFTHVYRIWISNDYVLVKWPPIIEEDEKKTEAPPSDLEVAFNMIGNLFGEDGSGAGEEEVEVVDMSDHHKKRTMRGFKLPTLSPTGNKIDGPIKMPPLPLKSVLRKKRESMGIKAINTSNPLKELKNDELEKDKFGTTGNIIDINDPWAQYEEIDELENNSKNMEIESKKNLRRGFSKHPWIIKLSKLLQKSFIFKIFRRIFASCISCCKYATVRYEKISPRLSDPPLIKNDDDEEVIQPTSTSAIEKSNIEMNEIKPIPEKKIDENKGIESNINKQGLIKKEKSKVKMKEKDEENTIRTTDGIDIMPGETDGLLSDTVDFQKLSFWQAVISGYLTNQEYITLLSFYGGLFMIMIMGIVLNKMVSPNWLGPTIWIATWTFICTIAPVIKYFHIYEITNDMKYLVGFVILIHIIYCISFFAVEVQGDLGKPSALWILDYFLYYPIFLYLGIELYKWKDNNWIIQRLDINGDGSVTWREYLSFFRAYPLIISMLIILNWQFYIWTSILIGLIFTLGLIVSIVGYSFARDWAASNFFVSPEFRFFGDLILRIILLISFLVSLFSTDIPTFSLSVFFFTLIFRCLANIFGRIMTLDIDSIIYFSPHVMPVYSYDSTNHDVIDETFVAKQLFGVLVTGVLWGASMSIFLYPISVGTGTACLFLLIVAAVIASTISYIPHRLGKFSTMLTINNIRDAANAAAQRFVERKSPLDIEIRDWEGEEIQEIPSSISRNIYGINNRRNQKTCIEYANDILTDIRSLSYIKSDKNFEELMLQQQSFTSGGGIIEEEERIINWKDMIWNKIHSTIQKIFELFPKNIIKGWNKHSEALLNISDILAITNITGRGPFAIFGLEGLWYRFLKFAKINPRLTFLRQKWIDEYDLNGNYIHAITLSESFNSIHILGRLNESDHSLDESFYEETRCAIHFLLVLLVSAEAQLQREQILFQRFLRENRFRLASNGITPPADIFTSTSFASIDISLVAIWLYRLTPEEQERFHQLKVSFSEEQAKRDERIDDEDYLQTLEASKLLVQRQQREKVMADKLRKDFARSLLERVKAFVNTLTIEDKTRFAQVMSIWTVNLDCIIEPNDQGLYERFKAAVMQHSDEVQEYARHTLSEIEAAQRDCRIGEYGRMYQFVDPDFPPSDHSIGDCKNKSFIQSWRSAPGICESIQLFDGGTDPDDVQNGIFNNNWLLSAISMISAAGGIGDGQIEEQVLNLFIGKLGLDGEMSYNTDVGCYGIRLYKQGIWHPIILDDIFPILKQDKWTNENRGIASAHAKECRELWITLIEKAFAKYYGSYAALERGYVHHALQDLTGAEAEAIPLGNASRGPGKQALWDKLIRYRRNGFILGAGTGDKSTVDSDIKEMGIIFNATYIIYEVCKIDSLQLLKLRNPPGDHEEWQGDWSDKSSLWTTRLKKKLGWNGDITDNTFWISFDDFCNVFRILYVCKWYALNKWSEYKMMGKWKAIKEYDGNMSTSSETTTPTTTPNNNNMNHHQEADTAGGLPSKHNPICQLNNNPHYKLQIYRPTEIRITLSQTDARGVARAEALPAAIYICTSSHPTMPMRLKVLSRDNVLYHSGIPMKQRTQHLYATLRPGMYIILVATYISKMGGIFSLSILSNYRIGFTQFWPARWLVDGKMVEGDDSDKETKELKKLTNMFTNTIHTLIGTGKGNDKEKEIKLKGEKNDKKDDDDELLEDEALGEMQADVDIETGSSTIKEGKI